MGHVLIIAPNPDLRTSLQFALEAEGHIVTIHASIDQVGEAPENFDCTILDHHGVGRSVNVAIFFRVFQPVVLLANEASDPLASASFRTVLKPQLGASLSQAVTQAIHATRR